MIRTKKKIDVAEISVKNDVKNLRLLELDNIQITTNDKTKIVYFSYSETPFLYENAQRQVVIDDAPQFNDDGTPLMESYQKPVKDLEFPTKLRKKKYDYESWFAIREQLRQLLPDNLTGAEAYIALNKTGLKTIIVQEGFYKGQFTLNDFE